MMAFNFLFDIASDTIKPMCHFVIFNAFYSLFTYAALNKKAP
jgi:hypothetical protein